MLPFPPKVDGNSIPNAVTSSHICKSSVRLSCRLEIFISLHHSASPLRSLEAASLSSLSARHARVLVCSLRRPPGPICRSSPPPALACARVLALLPPPLLLHYFTPSTRSSPEGASPALTSCAGRSPRS